MKPDWFEIFSIIAFPLVDRRSKNNEPKNKLNLSDEQIELLKTMTPKQKKKFIRGLK